MTNPAPSAITFKVARTVHNSDGGPGYATIRGVDNSRTYFQSCGHFCRGGNPIECCRCDGEAHCSICAVAIA